MIKKMNIIALIAFVFAGTSFANAMERNKDDIYGSLSLKPLDLDDLYDDNEDDRVAPIQVNQAEYNRAVEFFKQAADQEVDREATEWFKKTEQEEYNRAIRFLKQTKNQSLGAMDLNISNQQKNNITQ